MLKVVHGRADDTAASSPVPARQLYRHLLQDPAPSREQARNYLRQCLSIAAARPAELPADARELPGWSRRGRQEVGRRYRDYLNRRRAGGERQFFSSKSHALAFLRGVAPTKLVDGAWLYGLLRHWRDERFAPLIHTYLEELGEGRPAHNHVLLYRRLLDRHGCGDWQALSDEHFVQGAVQLGFAELADEFLPELLGYNLGYEQLPLHLLITAYELNELGIDPYYFTLHVTVDNTASGHARKAVESVLELMPAGAEGEAFYRRLHNGYQLNTLGSGTLSVIDAFEPEQELIRVLQAKAEAGAELHSDYCRIGGATVNEWLRQPARLPAFLRALERAGWIRRGQDPAESRFWRLIDGERGAMFGVFNRYEKQLLRDWIQGYTPREPSFRARSRAAAEPAAPPAVPEGRAEVAACTDIEALLAALAPSRQHTPAGLAATRRFCELWERR